MNDRVANPLAAAHDDARWFRERTAAGRLFRRWFDAFASDALVNEGTAAVRRLRSVGQALHRLGLLPPRPDAVRALFEELGPADARRVAADAAGQRLVNRAMAAVFERQLLHRLTSLVAPESAAMPAALATRGSGVVLATWHLGTHFGVSVAALRWGLPLFVVRNQAVWTAESRAVALKDAVDHARAGGTVVAVIDGPGGASCRPVPWLGRRVLVRRGPFVLSRLAGVPVVPIVAQWTASGEIRVCVAPAIAPIAGPAEESERAMASVATSWASRYARTYPGDVWPYTLGNLLGVPVSASEQHIRVEAAVLDARP